MIIKKERYLLLKLILEKNNLVLSFIIILSILGALATFFILDSCYTKHITLLHNIKTTYDLNSLDPEKCDELLYQIMSFNNQCSQSSDIIVQTLDCS